VGICDTRLAVGMEVVEMRRIDYLNDPTAPKANSIVVATSAYVENDDGQILLIRRTDNGLWSLPGGGMEPGETVIGCAVREVKEETGIAVEVTGLVGIFSNPDHVVAYPDGEVRQGFSICVSARPASGTVQASDESSEVAWVSRDELNRRNMHPEIRRRIERALAHDPTPYLD
jgi:ADP-ribose pyrophosphatase YjhB (NUDIX family)